MILSRSRRDKRYKLGQSLGKRLPKLVVFCAESEVPSAAVEGTSDVQVWREHGGRVSAYGISVNGQHWVNLPRVGSFHFSARADQIRALALPGVSSELIEDAYRRIVLPLALQALGTEVLHASAVLTTCGVVAFCAVSGVGKSTIAFALSCRGYPLWADDSVALETEARSVRAIPIPFKIRLKREAAKLFNPESLSHSKAEDNHVVENQPLLALMLLNRITVSDSPDVEMTRLLPSRAFPAVLKHAHCFSLADPERKRQMMTSYFEVVNRVPVFELHFRTGLEKIPLILDQIEQSISDLSPSKA